MSGEICLVAILFRKNEFNDSIILEAIRSTEEKFTKPHPHPEELYIKIEVDDSVSVVFYEVRGYRNSATNFHLTIELFREDQFPSIVKSCAQKSRQSFCFYVYMLDSYDDFKIACRYDESGFEEWQSIHGSVTKITEKNKRPVQQEFLTNDHVLSQPDLVTHRIFNWLGVTSGEINRAWTNRYEKATIIARFYNSEEAV